MAGNPWIWRLFWCFFPVRVGGTYKVFEVCFLALSVQAALGAMPGKSHGRRSMVGCSPWGR